MCGKFHPVEGHVFDSLAYSTISGSRCLGHPGRKRGNSTGKRQRARSRALRRALVEILGEGNYDAGQRLLAPGAVSCRLLGRELGGVDGSTACRLKGRMRERFRAALLAAVGRTPRRRGRAWAWAERLLTGLAAGAVADAALDALRIWPGATSRIG